MTRDDGRCVSCRELDAVLDGFFDAHPQARLIRDSDPQTRYYLGVLREVAHDHVVRLDPDALTARLADGFARRHEAEVAARVLSAQPLPLALIEELRAQRGEGPT